MLIIRIKYFLARIIKNDFLFICLRYLIRHKKIPNLKKPATFNEKLAYCKLKNRKKIHNSLVDKQLVKPYVKKRIGAKHIIESLVITSDPNSIDFQALPDSFIIKATHGSGWNIIVRDKNKANIKQIIKKCKFFLSMNYYYFGREYQYCNIKPQILIEKLLIDEAGNIPKDYKLFCFSGEVKFIQVDINRSGDHRRNFYDTKWNRISLEFNYPSSIKDVDIPNNLNEMLKIANTLSQEFAFVRIDLYSISNQIFFGEMTFTPEGSLGKFYPNKYDSIFGDFFDIDFES